ncbi:MAG: cytochrome d ubiquinol oxidase subunit II [Limibacillus sp.]
MELDLAFIWAGLIAFAVCAYVVLDGFDLGVGILFPFLGDDSERDLAMNSVAPVWDGNETWLVPDDLAMPMIPRLGHGRIEVGRQRSRILWDVGFFGGSLIAAFAQGIALGALVQGIEVENRAYAGGWWDWLTPFSIVTGVALVIGYALLGASWLVMKTEGLLAARARDYAWRSGVVTLLLIGAVSLATPFQNSAYVARWFAWPTAAFSIIVPLLVGLCCLGFWWGLKRHHDWLPFLSAQGVFLLCYAGIGISFYPYMVPPSITIWQAAAPDKSLGFLLVGALFLIPIILCYTAYAYWIFRGKVDPDEGYH